MLAACIAYINTVSYCICTKNPNESFLIMQIFLPILDSRCTLSLTGQGVIGGALPPCNSACVPIYLGNEMMTPETSRLFPVCGAPSSCSRRIPET